MNNHRERVRDLVFGIPRKGDKDAFSLYHFSAEEKLISANYFYSQIVSLNEENYKEPYKEEDNREKEDNRDISTGTYTYKRIKGKELLRDINRFLDCYFFSAWSSLDALIHELNSIIKFAAEDDDL